MTDTRIVVDVSFKVGLDESLVLSPRVGGGDHEYVKCRLEDALHAIGGDACVASWDRDSGDLEIEESPIPGRSAIRFSPEMYPDGRKSWICFSGEPSNAVAEWDPDALRWVTTR